MPRLVLASASPRRRELLATLGLPFAVDPSNADESLPAGIDGGAAVRMLAERKAAAVGPRCSDAAVLTADTVVVLDGDILGKPDSPAAARRILRRLRGRTHRVFTGICLRAGEDGQTRVVATDVKIRDYSDAEIERSIARGTPFDKAGAYAIQDLDLAPVESIAGCYCSVMGLPLWDVWELLRLEGLGAGMRTPDGSRPCCRICPRRQLTTEAPDRPSAPPRPGRPSDSRSCP